MPQQSQNQWRLQALWLGRTLSPASHLLHQAWQQKSRHYTKPKARGRDALRNELSLADGWFHSKVARRFRFAQIVEACKSLESNAQVEKIAITLLKLAASALGLVDTWEPRPIAPVRASILPRIVGPQENCRLKLEICRRNRDFLAIHL